MFSLSFNRARDPIPRSRRRRRRNVVNRPCNEKQYESLLFVVDWPQTRCTFAKVHLHSIIMTFLSVFYNYRRKPVCYLQERPNLLDLSQNIIAFRRCSYALSKMQSKSDLFPARVSLTPFQFEGFVVSLSDISVNKDEG